MATGDLGAKRYAQAAFELASESNSLSDWGVALGRIAEFMGNPEVEGVLENTRIATDAKLALIESALIDVSPQALNLARLIVRKGRTRLAPEIATEFARLSDESQGISHAIAVTAVPLSEAERVALVDRLQAQTGKRILLETEVDPSLIGGLRLQIGDKMVDGSTRARLSALRENLVGSV